MPELEKQEEREYETTLRSAEFIGRNTYGQHSSLLPGEMRECTNYDVHKRYLKSRRGSQYLGTYTNPGYAVQNNITWDVGDEEYVLYQRGKRIYYHRVDTSSSSVEAVLDLDDDVLQLTNENRADLFLDGDKLFVMHEGGNKIIHWDSSASEFRARTLGLDYPKISTLSTPAGSGGLTGDYIWAVELIYFPSDVADISYSSPNRYTTTRVLAKISDLTTAVLPTIVVDSAKLDSYNWWTHLRLWRTLRLDIDDDDVGTEAKPVDGAGVPDELYLVAEITKAEMESAVAPVLADSTKPAGNEFVTAGNAGSIATPVYTITDACPLSYLDGAVFVDIQRIELVPLPAAKIGVSHANRIYVSNVQQTTLNNDKKIDDSSKNDIWYSNWGGTPYSELTSTLQFVPTTRNGQKMVRLISFEKDLIGLKEAQTVRLPDGFVDLKPEISDHRIGIKEPDFVQFVPGLGLCALTSDYNDFSIYGYDHVWRKTFNNIDISLAIREDMKDIVNLSTVPVSFIYINGKVFFSQGSGSAVYVLNVESKRGWSKYSYPVDKIERLFVFGNGRRAGYIPTTGRIVEIEVEDLDTDVNIQTGDDAIDITLTHDTWMWQSGDGADVLEQQWLAVMAYTPNSIAGAPYINGLPWPNKTTALAWGFVGQTGDLEALSDREYRLYIKPQTMGSFKWMPPVGNFIHHRITALAPCVMKVHKLRCVVDTDGLSYGGFDPYQVFSEPFGPSWAESIGNIIETGDSTDDTITETGSSSDDTITEIGE